MSPEQKLIVKNLMELTDFNHPLPLCKDDEGWLFYLLVKELSWIALLIKDRSTKLVEEQKAFLSYQLNYLIKEEAKD